LRTEGGERPVRTCKIDGQRYELAAVGMRKELWAEAKRMNERDGFSAIDTSHEKWGGPRYHYTWKETDHGAPARLKYATWPQIASWPELKAYVQCDELGRPSLLWRKLDPSKQMFCADDCEDCSKARLAFAA